MFRSCSVFVCLRVRGTDYMRILFLFWEIQCSCLLFNFAAFTWYLVNYLGFSSPLLFLDLSCFTVITTGLIKYSSERLSIFIICLSSRVCWILFLLYLLGGVVPVFLYAVWGGTCCGMWIFDFLILVHKWEYFSNIHTAMLFCIDCILRIFSPGVV